MTQYPDIFAALAAPFATHEVKVRQQAGRQLHYITARTAMNRLDSILGPENWWDEFIPSDHSVLCKLTIRLPDGTLLTKADAGGYAGMSDQGDDDKSGYSDAFKRAAVKFGIARYLYRDGVPEFVRERVPAQEVASGEPQPTISSASPVPAPAESPARRDREQPARARNGVQTAPPRESGGHGGGVVGTPPRSGRALFAWVKDQESRHEVGLLQYLNKWGKLQDFPGRMVDWDADQVANAYQEAMRKIQSSQPDRNEALEEALAN
ncbi:Rad52/Rad22 family DNA repair protein [Tautonia plasticadhaerens]|uniref:Rad52/22 family double-strand break repair protein n=1 Tax=Tautonia plasticadhaerens TaxID=2527974 RepID=A0A518H6P5_9BACT|nr:Rad52/Rad22 family DNA repair protein [Tautonia plasticadhaerens]QDV36486.1 Rad52/22 family double-strand break repair protein [Tautonia plasticadhaerens]